MKQTIWNQFSVAAAQVPQKTAIICDGISVQYGQLFDVCAKYCSYFCANGLAAGMHVGLWVEKSIDFVAALFALFRAGAVAVPLNTSATTDMIDASVSAADLKWIVYGKRMAAKAAELSPRKQLRLISLSDAAQMDTVCAEAEAYCENALFLMTSGSTGNPKVAVISQDAMLYRLELEQRHFALSSDDCVLVSTPIYHSLGIRFIMTALTRGMTVVLPKAFQAEQWLHLIQDNHVTYTITVPSQIVEILEVTKDKQSVARQMLRSVRVILSTSAYLPQKVKQNFLSLISGQFYNFIASSETEFMAIANCRWNDPEGDLLGEAFPSVDLQIIRAGKPVTQGEVGEIVCRSRQLFSAYYGDSELTRRAFWEDYYRTGDLGFFDNSGRLHYAGRKKNTIICSGVNIYPRDIEQAVSQIKQVTECAAFGLPHPKCGEILAIAVAGQDLTQEAIIRFCLHKLAPYQQPRKIILLKELPKNEIGKVDIRQLKNDYS